MTENKEKDKNPNTYTHEVKDFTGLSKGKIRNGNHTTQTQTHNTTKKQKTIEMVGHSLCVFSTSFFIERVECFRPRLT